jgi:hypothetical protein
VVQTNPVTVHGVIQATYSGSQLSLFQTAEDARAFLDLFSPLADEFSWEETNKIYTYEGSPTHSEAVRTTNNLHKLQYALKLKGIKTFRLESPVLDHIELPQTILDLVLIDRVERIYLHGFTGNSDPTSEDPTDQEIVHLHFQDLIIE